MFQDDDFYQKKSIIDLSSPFKNSSNHPIGLKISQHTQIELGFQIAIQLENRRGSFLTCLIFSDSRS
jgi:hypothetical protein